MKESLWWVDELLNNSARLLERAAKPLKSSEILFADMLRLQRGNSEQQRLAFDDHRKEALGKFDYLLEVGRITAEQSQTLKDEW